MRICLFGPFVLEVEGRRVDSQDLSRRARQLVELLALAPDRRLSGDEVVEALFGHLGAGAGRANLHKAASLVRRAAGDRSAVVLSGGMVSLWPGAAVDCDAARFVGEAGAALAGGDPGACGRVLAGYRDDLLPAERFEPWAEAGRRRLGRLAVDLARAAGEWARLVELDPADEAAHREVMRGLGRAGDRAGVRRQYEWLRAELAGLGLAPGDETVRLAERLTVGRPATAPLAAVVPFVGRRAELARARAVWRTAAGGHGGGLLIRGEPGIGKTCLAERLLAEASAAGWSTARGAAARVEAPIPYAPVVEAVGGLLGDRPDLAERLAAPAVAVLDRLTAATRGPGAGGGDASFSAQQVVSVVARLVATAAREHGLVLLVDDLHAADDETVALVHFLVRSATFQRVLVVATVRDGALRRVVADARAELLAGRRAEEIALGPLSPDESAELVALVAPGGAGGATSRPVAELWARSGGNPFLLRELAATTGERAAAVVGGRLDGLDPVQGAALGRMAVVGEEVSAAELAAVTGLDGGAARRIAADAVAAGILTRDGGGYRFRHGLVRDALVEALPPDWRAAIHRDVAAALERTGAPPLRVAHHLLASDRAVDAVGHLVEAALQAMAVGAFATARTCVERALPLAPTDGVVAALRADAAYATGDPAAPLRYADAVAVAAPDRRGPLLVRQARAHVAANDPATAAAVLGEASVEDPADVALHRLVEGQIAWLRGDLDSCEVAVDEARAAGLAHGVMDVVYGAMSLRDLVLHQRGRFPEALRRDLLEAGDSPVLAAVVHDAHLCGVETYLYGGQPYGKITSFARELAATAARSGARRGHAFAVTLLGEAQLLCGELDLAHRHLEEGVERHAAIGAPGGEALARQRLAQVHLASGRGDEARRLLAAALPLARQHPAVGWHIVSRVYGTMVEAGESAGEAVVVVDEGEIALRGGMAQVCPPCSVSFLLPAATACAAAGDLDRASRFIDQAEPWVAALWPQAGWRAALDEARGHVHRAEGRTDDARALLAAAADRFGTAGQPLDAQRCTTALAQLR